MTGSGTDPAVRSRTVEMAARNSDCGTYQYWLARQSGPGPALVFVMLNPSTADAYVDDPTVVRCIKFAAREGFDGILLLNLYAYISAYPAELLVCGDAVGPDNDTHLRRTLTEQVQRGAPVVAGWGWNAERKQVAQRVAQVRSLVPGVDWRCLGFTKKGHPSHPQRLPGDTPLVPLDVSGAARS